MKMDLTDDKLTLVQVMAWCRQATSHYLSQCWPRPMSPNGVIKPQWVNKIIPKTSGWCDELSGKLSNKRLGLHNLRGISLTPYIPLGSRNMRWWMFSKALLISSLCNTYLCGARNVWCPWAATTLTGVMVVVITRPVTTRYCIQRGILLVEYSSYVRGGSRIWS